MHYAIQLDNLEVYRPEESDTLTSPAELVPKDLLDTKTKVSKTIPLSESKLQLLISQFVDSLFFYVALFLS